MKELKLKAYLVTFNTHARNSGGQIKGLILIAQDKKEAMRMFDYWTLFISCHTEWNIEILSIKNIRKSKINEHLFTKEFYEKEWQQLRDFQDIPATKPIEGGETNED